MIINFNLLINIFLPNWPQLNEVEIIKIKKNIYKNIKEHYLVLPSILKIALNLIYIFFIVYYMIINSLYILSLKKFNNKKIVLYFFQINKLFFNFEKFFRSLINLYFFEEIELNYKKKIYD